MKLYRSNKFIEKVATSVNLSVTNNRIIKSLIMMIFLLHMIGCLWAMTAGLTAGDVPNNWMIDAGL